MWHTCSLTISSTSWILQKKFHSLSLLGFGHIEVGTLTPKAQPGNDQPRLFRLPKDEALINRMGFNNGGSQAAAWRLKSRPQGVIIGGNIGKNKITPNEDAVSDYLQAFEDLYDHVDYFVVNVSSPNTPGLRALQDKEPLLALLKSVQTLNHSKPQKRPLALKIAPDLTDEQLNDILDIAKEVSLDAIIATNTTLDRSSLRTDGKAVEAIGAGGLSGAPLRSRSTEVVRYLKTNAQSSFAIIAVGGIMSASDMREKIDAGADLVQVYTGFIYRGPGIVKQMLRG
ncbi:MAG: quinone-dependent dihydroorotate dehydrogenase [Flavobacteriales bacterium]